MSPSPPASIGASPPTPDRTRLTGVSVKLDRRTHAVRRDLSDIALAGRVIACGYARAVPMACATERTPVRGEPSREAAPSSELLFGEIFEVLELGEAWAWGRSAHDGYVGYVRAAALQPGGDAAPTHRIVARLGLVFAAASIKAPVVARLPLGARIHAQAEDGAFLRTAAGWIHRRHADRADTSEPDHVAVAEQLLGAPYGWGGRSEAGVDCSGLVQIALMACGVACPRDTDQQREGVGTGVDPAGPLRRGDLVYFPGHVGIMIDGARLLHANAFWMSTVVEPLAAVVARLRPQHAEPVVAVRRL